MFKKFFQCLQKRNVFIYKVACKYIWVWMTVSATLRPDVVDNSQIDRYDLEKLTGVFLVAYGIGDDVTYYLAGASADRIFAAAGASLDTIKGLLGEIGEESLDEDLLLDEQIEKHNKRLVSTLGDTISLRTARWLIGLEPEPEEYDKLPFAGFMETGSNATIIAGFKARGVDTLQLDTLNGKEFLDVAQNHAKDYFLAYYNEGIRTDQ